MGEEGGSGLVSEKFQPEGAEEVDYILHGSTKPSSRSVAISSDDAGVDVRKRLRRNAALLLLSS